MAIIQVFTGTVATGASVSSRFDLGKGEFTRFAVALPQVTSVFATEAVNCRMNGTVHSGTTYFAIGYSNNPATATSGFKPWEAAQNSWGSMVICEAALFAPSVQLSFTALATQAASFYIFAGKE